MSGRVSVPCWLATPVANAPWKPLIIRWRSDIIRNHNFAFSENFRKYLWWKHCKNKEWVSLFSLFMGNKSKHGTNKSPDCLSRLRFIPHGLRKGNHSLNICMNTCIIISLITPPTGLSQSCRSIDPTWRVYYGATVYRRSNNGIRDPLKMLIIS